MKIKNAIAALLLTLSSAALGATSGKLPFIQDDYPNAVRLAGQRHVALFVEVWAPW